MLCGTFGHRRVLVMSGWLCFSPWVHVSAQSHQSFWVAYDKKYHFMQCCHSHWSSFGFCRAFQTHLVMRWDLRWKLKGWKKTMWMHELQQMTNAGKKEWRKEQERHLSKCNLSKDDFGLALKGFWSIIIRPDKVFCLPLLAGMKRVEHGWHPTYATV